MLPIWDSLCWLSAGFRWLVRWQVFFLSSFLFWIRIVSLSLCSYIYWLFSAWSLQSLLPSLRFSIWTSAQSCIPEVKELPEPCLKHRSSFLFLLCHWWAVSSKFLLFKSFWAVRDILLRYVSSKLRFLLFFGRVEPFFPETQRRLWATFFKTLPDFWGKNHFLEFLES